MNTIDVLRPPPPFDAAATAYKDWLHLNILDHATGAVGLVNASLHGAPGEDRSRAVGAALVHIPKAGWVGGVEVLGMSEADIGISGIGLEKVGLALDAHGGVLASVRDPEQRLVLNVRGEPAAAPVRIEERLPFGSGWISWNVVPRLTLSGTWTFGALTRDLGSASGYQDHNWGRWHWGDDAGWEWGCFLAASPGPAFVLSRSTDRAHVRCGPPSLAVRAGADRRTFTGPAVVIEYSGTLEEPLRRVPGAMAALHQDRAQPKLPALVTIRAADGVDELELTFTPRAAAQLITADPVRRGYGFIHEMPGEFTCRGAMGRQDLSASGLGMFEYVD